jgi:hypothetical protein
LQITHVVAAGASRNVIYRQRMQRGCRSAR